MHPPCSDFDPDLFFPPPGSKPPEWALALCDTCPVYEECEDAGKDAPYGWFAGKSPRSRGFASGYRTG